MKKWFLCILMLAFLLSGCHEDNVSTTLASTPPTTVSTTIEPTQTQPTTLPQLSYESSFCNFGEPHGYTYDSKRSMMTRYNEITYHFTTNIDEDTRLQIILESDALIQLLLADHPEYTPELTVCFRKGDYAPRVMDHTLYIGTDQFQTQDYAVGMAVMVFGHDVNYGILYAKGIQASTAMGYETEEFIDLQEALYLYDSFPMYLDLNYACFRSEYSTPQKLEKVKSISVHFYAYLEQNGKLDLLTDYSDAKFCEYLSLFLTENGKGSYDNSDLNGTIFYYGGPYIRLVWENADATYYVNYDFKVQYQESQFAEDMLGSGYHNLRQLVVDYQLQADHMEAILGHLENEDSRVDVVFTERFASEMYVAAQYHEWDNLIEMFSAGPFLHEYTHYLLRDTEIALWMNELICYYYGYHPVSEQLSYSWNDEVTRISGLSLYNPETEVEAYLIKVLREHLGRRIRWDDPADFEYIFSAYVVVTRNFDYLTDPNGGATSKYSFMAYLIEQVGEAETLDAIVNNTPVDTFGHDWQWLMEDWEAGLRAEYAWLGEYFIID